MWFGLVLSDLAALISFSECNLFRNCALTSLTNSCLHNQFGKVVWLWLAGQYSQ